MCDSRMRAIVMWKRWAWISAGPLGRGTVNRRHRWLLNSLQSGPTTCPARSSILRDCSFLPLTRATATVPFGYSAFRRASSSSAPAYSVSHRRQTQGTDGVARRPETPAIARRGVQQVVDIDVGLPASLLVAPRGCGQYPLCPLRRKFVQRHLGDVDGNQRKSSDFPISALRPSKAWPSSISTPPSTIGSTWTGGPSTATSSRNLLPNGVSRDARLPPGRRRATSCLPADNPTHPHPERPRHRKPGIQASGEFGRDTFFRPPVFGAFLHGAPPTGFFIVEVCFGVEGVLGRKHPKWDRRRSFPLSKEG